MSKRTKQSSASFFLTHVISSFALLSFVLSICSRELTCMIRRVITRTVQYSTVLTVYPYTVSVTTVSIGIYPGVSIHTSTFISLVQVYRSYHTCIVSYDDEPKGESSKTEESPELFHTRPDRDRGATLRRTRAARTWVTHPVGMPSSIGARPAVPSDAIAVEAFIDG